MTDRGRELLESRRSHGHDTRQQYYAGVKRERELEHDSQVYEAYARTAERLAERSAHVERAALDYELIRQRLRSCITSSRLYDEAWTPGQNVL